MSSDFDFLDDDFGVSATMHHPDVMFSDATLEVETLPDVRGSEAAPMLSFQHLTKCPTNQLPQSHPPLHRTLSAIVGTIPIDKSWKKKVRTPKCDSSASRETPEAPEDRQEEKYSWQKSIKRREPWLTAETDAFYEALNQFGTNFRMIAVMFPGKTRDDIVHKYKFECKKAPDRVQAATDSCSFRRVDKEKFEQCKRECEALRAAPQRELNADEEAHLQALDFELGAAAASDVSPQQPPLAGDADGFAHHDDFSFHATKAEADDSWFYDTTQTAVQTTQRSPTVDDMFTSNDAGLPTTQPKPLLTTQSKHKKRPRDAEVVTTVDQPVNVSATFSQHPPAAGLNSVDDPIAHFSDAVDATDVAAGFSFGDTTHFDPLNRHEERAPIPPKLDHQEPTLHVGSFQEKEHDPKGLDDLFDVADEFAAAGVAGDDAAETSDGGVFQQMATEDDEFDTFDTFHSDDDMF